MKILKISENQVKFILNSEDLNERDIKLSELAYGSEKAQELFREMMAQALIECDFYAEQNSPLIIEAIPTSHESVMIIVTKAPFQEQLEAQLNWDFLDKLKETVKKDKKRLNDTLQDDKNLGESSKNLRASAPKIQQPALFIFKFHTLDDVVQTAIRLANLPVVSSRLFRYEKNYYLVLKDFSQEMQSIIHDYAFPLANNVLSESFLIEHGETVIQENVIALLAQHFS